MNNQPANINPALAGCRQTKVRSAVLDILRDSEPLAAQDILIRLRRRSIIVNKTTVYRELDFLSGKQVLAEIVLADGVKRYELKAAGHCHHLVCLDCHHIEHVVMDNELAAQEKKISRTRHFRILNHSLEFYGLCRNCASK